MDSQAIRVELRGLPLLIDGKDVAAQEPRGEGELLERIEVVDAGGVTCPLVFGPQSELALGLFLPRLRGLGAHAQDIPVDLALEPEADADDVGAVGLDGAAGERRGHGQHPCPLPERGVVIVNILPGAAALCVKALCRPFVPARSGVPVTLILWAHTVREVQAEPLV